MKILSYNEIHHKTELAFESITHRLEVNWEEKEGTLFTGFAKKVFEDFYIKLQELCPNHWFNKIGITGRINPSLYCRKGYTNKAMIGCKNKLNWPTEEFKNGNVIKEFKNVNVQIFIL